MRTELAVLFAFLLSLQSSALLGEEANFVKPLTVTADSRAVLVVPEQGAAEYSALTPKLTPEALRDFERRAEKEDPTALDIVFFAHFSGFGCDANVNDARAWLNKAWHAGTPLGALFHGRNLLGLGFDAREHNETYGRSLVKAAEWRFIDAAKSGNAAAQFFVGLCHESVGDAPASFRWFSRAADQNFLLAQHHLALCHLNGLGTPQDAKQARTLLRNCAQQGLLQSQDQLAQLYFDGADFGRDDELALKWTRAAALRGEVHAQHRLGLLYQMGRGVLASDGSAAEWFERAAEQDFVPAQLKLAALYADGSGVNADQEVAANWYAKAAEQLDADAAAQLSARYAIGRGVPLDTLSARRWLYQAAQLGSVESQLTLAQAFTARNNVAEARKWLTKAAALGDNTAREQLAATEPPHPSSAAPEFDPLPRAIEVAVHFLDDLTPEVADKQ